MLPTKNKRIVPVVGCETGGGLEAILDSLDLSMRPVYDAEGIQSYLRSCERDIAAVILEAAIAGDDRFDLLREVRSMDPDLPIVIVGDRPSTRDIVSAMKSGASDFLSSPLNHDSVATALAGTLENYDAQNRPAFRVNNGAMFFVGGNARMREIQAMTGPVGRSGLPVLIQGETGSGKEVLARELHRRSVRANRPFLKLNCAALPSELVESELFGYERGAFTGAFQRKTGIFEMAEGGTLLLDEIGDMDFRLQAKLLQVLQDREFRRIGGKETVRVDVRIIAATHCNLENAILDRTFREDLYYRMNVMNLVVPPLRERREDIIPIGEFLLERHAEKGNPIPQISPDLERAMLAYHWPGNVRELENNMRKLMILQNCSLLANEIYARSARKQPVSVRTIENPGPVAERLPSGSVLEDATRAKELAETDAILQALNSTHWNRKQAASILNVDYKSLLYKMKKLGIQSSPISLSERSEYPFERVRSAAGD